MENGETSFEPNLERLIWRLMIKAEDPSGLGVYV